VSSREPAAEGFRIEPLSPSHNRAAFACGNEALDRYLHAQAGQDVLRKIAAVFVLNDTEANVVAGYYTLSATAIAPTDLPAEMTKKLPRYPALPAVLLGRLAVDMGYRSRRFGELLLLDALRRAEAHSAEVAAMAVVVDAIDDAARSFYERYGFERFEDEPYRLFLPMTTIARL
jgi:GNAT superfamily N-acetyltransferase